MLLKLIIEHKYQEDNHNIGKYNNSNKLNDQVNHLMV